MTAPVDSPTLNPLVKQLGLLKHPEGGYFLETDRQVNEVSSPFAGEWDQLDLKSVLTLGAEGGSRSLATSIYYLLDHDSPSGVIHMNKSVTYHVLHSGRAEYTLITPGNPPTIEKHVMGAGDNETRMLLVGTGVWKMSKLLAEDLDKATTEADKRNLGCLITEVVVPGFHWEDHKFLTTSDLLHLVSEHPDKEAIMKELGPHVKA
ncbi:RmlC-like cupin domain-containing protein [Roridomyces roridus]|uniref:RmlC-like cupin domain-containing protein n=1 Tax=Roridomyces roridus TaxID=1738132 RepID=A0AAD7BW47_9AGAR|nr:RmlC-like cupin domain-containing protein [Roridomyces roridus]